MYLLNIFPNRPDEICLANCNGQWYRVRCDTSRGDKTPIMLFIDFQIYNKVHVNDMRQMPSEFKIANYSLLAEIGGESLNFVVVTQS